MSAPFGRVDLDDAGGAVARHGFEAGRAEEMGRPHGWHRDEIGGDAERHDPAKTAAGQLLRQPDVGRAQATVAVPDRPLPAARVGRNAVAESGWPAERHVDADAAVGSIEEQAQVLVAGAGVGGRLDDLASA
jgi:hypothetical protein